MRRQGAPDRTPDRDFNRQIMRTVARAASRTWGRRPTSGGVLGITGADEPLLVSDMFAGRAWGGRDGRAVTKWRRDHGKQTDHRARHHGRHLRGVTPPGAGGYRSGCLGKHGGEAEEVVQGRRFWQLAPGHNLRPTRGSNADLDSHAGFGSTPST